VSETITLAGSRRVQTQREDTLQIVAARELGDATQWVVLAQINGLAPPYLVDNPDEVSPGVLLTGSLLIVPGTAPVNPSGVTDINTIFGSDVALSGGLLVDDGNGDFAVVSGPANMVQAVQNRLDSEPGELQFWLPYGCRVHELLGQGTSAPLVQLAASFVCAAVKQDPRISSASVTATAQGDQITATGAAVTVDGSIMPVSGVFK
jgi:phage baseplate assembly protein W